jgi:hypothetical protein
MQTVLSWLASTILESVIRCDTYTKTCSRANFLPRKYLCNREENKTNCNSTPGEGSCVFGVGAGQGRNFFFWKIETHSFMFLFREKIVWKYLTKCFFFVLSVATGAGALKFFSWGPLRRRLRGDNFAITPIDLFASSLRPLNYCE